MKQDNSTPMPGLQEIWTAQINVTMMAVEALIANHPEPEKVRATFDQLLGQVQAGMLAQGMTPLGSQLLRKMADKIFS